jgi:hypothetical protein
MAVSDAALEVRRNLKTCSFKMDSVVERIDPTATNPLVQANAAVGFQTGVVLITDDEFETILALGRHARGT